MANSAKLSGETLNENGTSIINKGFCWSYSPNSSVSDNKVLTGNGIGAFAQRIQPIASDTLVYVRAFASSSLGYAYGNELSFFTKFFVTNPGAGVTFDGYTYSSIVIGNGQEWMAENLRTNSYANGDPISNVTDTRQWANLTTGAWAHYNNDSIFENPYGKLYNWYAVKDSRNVCPTGWHVPSDAEWILLTDYLGGVSGAGGRMKSTGTQYWYSPNRNATNESGFSGLPGGFRSHNGLFGGIGERGSWWSSTEASTSNAKRRDLYYDYGIVSRLTTNKGIGLSVRCLRD
jgi:uncharacterized protein (TIGR02145 family)